MSSLVDIIFAVEESGFIFVERKEWIAEMISVLDASLTANNLDSRYAIIGYSNQDINKISVGGSEFGNLSSFITALDDLSYNAGYADGYNVINFIIDNGYDFRSGAQKAIILIGETSRVDASGDGNVVPNKKTTIFNLDKNNYLFHCLTGVTLDNALGEKGLGIRFDGDVYDLDGDGGYEITTVDTSTACDQGTTTNCDDYVDIAWQVDGIAWDSSFVASGVILDRSSFTGAFATELANNFIEKICEINIYPQEIPFYLSPNLVGEKSTFVLFDYRNKDENSAKTFDFRITFFNDPDKNNVISSFFSFSDNKRWFVNGSSLEPITKSGVSLNRKEDVQIIYIPDFLPQQVMEQQWSAEDVIVNRGSSVVEKSLLCGVDYYAFIEAYDRITKKFDPITFRVVNVPCSQVEMKSWREDLDKKNWICSGQGKMDLKVSSSTDQSLMSNVSSNELGNFFVSWQGRDGDGQSIYSAIWDSDNDILVSSGQGYYDRLVSVEGSRPKVLLDHKQNFYTASGTTDNIFVSDCSFSLTTVDEDSVSTSEISYLCYPGYGVFLENVKMRIFDEDSKGSYVISKDKVITVVDKTSIRIEVAQAFGAYAVRLRNSDNEDWGGWIAIDNKLQISSSISTDIQHKAFLIDDERFVTEWTLPKINGVRRICCQVLTFFGVTQTFCIDVFVNMDVLNYYVEFYQDENLTTPFVFYKGRFLVSEKKGENGIPESEDVEPYVPTNVYVKIIFDQEQTYATNELKFNMIQEGTRDQYDNNLTRVDSKTYKGSFQIYKNDGIFNIDGFAFIDIIFPDNIINSGSVCLSDETDKYNLMISSKDITRYTDSGTKDVFEKYVKSKIFKDFDINEFKQFYKTDDENFVFGNPDVFINVFKEETSDEANLPSP